MFQLRVLCCCCLMLLCSLTKGSAISATVTRRHHPHYPHHHQQHGFFESLQENGHQVKSRKSAAAAAPGTLAGAQLSPPSSDTQRKIEEFMESFYVKSLRIEMQKSQILNSFPPDTLPDTILAQRENSSAEEESAAASPSAEYEGGEGEDDDDDDDQQMIDFVRQVGSSIEQKEDEGEGEERNDLAEELETGSWLQNIRPIYRFIKDHMERFERELREHKKRMERVWKQVQEERHALEREEGDEPFDVWDFEQEMEQREIIFLDEVDCDYVFKGYYPTSPAEVKEYLDFCLQIDRTKFRPMVEAASSMNHTETNSVSELPQLQIEKAELWFYKANADAMDSHKQMFSLKSIDNWDADGKYKKFETISLKQSPTTVGWISADVSSPLVEWLSPMAFATLHKAHHRHRNTAYHKKRNLDAYFAWKRNFGHSSKHKFFLNVSCRTCLGNGTTESSSKGNKRATEDTHRPFFLIDYKRIDRPRRGRRRQSDGLGGDLAEEGDAARSSRQRRNLECTDSMRDCCRERLWIDFKDHGMDFIISPRGYYANFCRGDCKTAADNAVRSSHNSLVRNYAQSNPVKARRLGLKTCCSATAYNDLNVVYLGKNNSVSNRTLSNMIVAGCGCN